MADKGKSGVAVSDNGDKFGFHVTKYDNSGKPGDKGTRTSSDWVSSVGGWRKEKETEHSTNQNVPKGKPGRHG